MSGVGPAPGRHGGDGARVAAAFGWHPREVLDLSASLNPVAPDVVALAREHLDAVGRYPDPVGATAALASAMGVDPGELLLTNGGAEAIALVAAEVGGAVLAEPDFSLYPRGVSGPPDGQPAHFPTWRSNPHSPSGDLVDPLATEWRQVRVWDEAFFPLATGRWTSGVHHDGAVVVGSLTKLWSCPGLRLGYVLDADRDRMARLRARQPAWSVGTLAAAVVKDLLTCTDLPRWARAVADLRGRLVEALRAAVGEGVRIEVGAAPWVWVHGAAGWRDALMQRGVVVRDGATLGRVGAVRIAVPDDAGRERLLGALAWGRGAGCL